MRIRAMHLAGLRPHRVRLGHNGQPVAALSTMPSPEVIFEDNHLLVVNKRAGIATMGTPAGEPSLVDEAKAYLKLKYDKPGNVYLGVVSRLDAPVSGVLVFARTSKAAARLTKQFQQREVDKVYWALVPKGLPTSGICEDWVVHQERNRRMVTCDPNHPGAAFARLSYETLGHRGTCQHLAIQLETGRKHQIRLQLAERGHPILGDAKYGSERKFPRGIALHAQSLEFTHPVGKQPLRFEASPPSSWERFLPG